MLFNNKLAVLAILACLVRTDAANIENLPEALDPVSSNLVQTDGSDFIKAVDPEIKDTYESFTEVRLSVPMSDEALQDVKSDYKGILKIIYSMSQGKGGKSVEDKSNDAQTPYIETLLNDIEKDGVDVIVTKGAMIIDENDPSGAYFDLLEEAMKRNKLEAFKKILSLFDPSNFIFNRALASAGKSAGEGKFRPFKILPTLAKITKVVAKRVAGTGISRNISQANHSRFDSVDLLLDLMLSYLIPLDRVDFVKYIINDFKFIVEPDYYKYLDLAYKSKLKSTSSSLIKFLLSKLTFESKLKDFFNLTVEHEDVEAFLFLKNHLRLVSKDPKILDSIEKAFILGKTAFLKALNEMNFNLHALIDFAIKYSNQELLDSIVAKGVPADTITSNLGNILYNAMIAKNYSGFICLFDVVGNKSKTELFRLLMNSQYEEFVKIMKLLPKDFSEDFFNGLVEYLILNKQSDKVDYIKNTLGKGHSIRSQSHSSSEGELTPEDEIVKLLEAAYIRERGRSMSRNRSMSRSTSVSRSVSVIRNASPVRTRSFAVEADKPPYNLK